MKSMISELLLAYPWLALLLIMSTGCLLLLVIGLLVWLPRGFSRQRADWQQQEAAWEREQQYHERLATDLQDQLQTYRQDLQQEREKVLALSAQAARQEAELAQAQEGLGQQAQLLENAKLELKREFELTANRLFESKNQQFNRTNQTLLENTLSPFKTQLQDFRKKVEDVYDKENAERNRLSGQVMELQRQATKIGEDAVNLARALKSTLR